MKKKPVFLYVLLGISILGLLMVIYSMIQMPNLIKAWNELLTDETAVQQMGGVETIKVQLATFEWSRTPLAMFLNIIPMILVGVSAFFLFFKKDVVKSTYSYLAMRVVVLIGSMITTLHSNQIAHSIVKDKEALAVFLQGNKFGVIYSVVAFLILSAIAYFGLRRYQKAVEKDELDAEVL